MPANVMRHRHRLNRALWALAAVQASLALIAVAIWFESPGDTMALPRQVRASDVATRPTSLESAWPVALRAARDWRPDAWPVSASMQVDFPWEVGPDPPPVADGGFVTFLFASAGSPGGPETLGVMVERLSGLVVRQQRLSWTDPLPEAIDLSPTAVSSAAALDIAEHVGGKAFRRGCPQQRHEVRLNAVTVAGGNPAWLVSYLDTRTPTINALELRIDAKTGELLDHLDRSTACDPVTPVAG